MPSLASRSAAAGFGGGGLLRKLLSSPLPGWAGEIGCTSWAQILLKFVLANKAVTCVIPGTGKPEHMRDNVQAGLGVYPVVEERAPPINADWHSPFHPPDHRIQQDDREPLLRAGHLLHALQLRSHSQTLRVTPATAAGVSRTLWTMDDVVKMVEACEVRLES